MIRIIGTSSITVKWWQWTNETVCESNGWWRRTNRACPRSTCQCDLDVISRAKMLRLSERSKSVKVQLERGLSRFRVWSLMGMEQSGSRSGRGWKDKIRAKNAVEKRNRKRDKLATRKSQNVWALGTQKACRSISLMAGQTASSNERGRTSENERQNESGSLCKMTKRQEPARQENEEGA